LCFFDMRALPCLFVCTSPASAAAAAAAAAATTTTTITTHITPRTHTYTPHHARAHTRTHAHAHTYTHARAHTRTHTHTRADNTSQSSEESQQRSLRLSCVWDRGDASTSRGLGSVCAAAHDDRPDSGQETASEHWCWHSPSHQRSVGRKTVCRSHPCIDNVLNANSCDHSVSTVTTYTFLCILLIFQGCRVSLLSILQV
jgi:hypothetical protein